MEGITQRIQSQPMPQSARIEHKPDAVRVPEETFSKSDTQGADVVAGPPAGAQKPVVKKKSAGEIILRTVIGAGEGALAGITGGVLGGVLGGLIGLGLGAKLGWTAGKAMAMKIAEKTGQGKINSVAGGISSLTVPILTTMLGAIGGATGGAVIGATGMPILGALVGGAAELSSALM
jgi:hypothetical protein